MNKKRIDALTGIILKFGVDAMFLTKRENIFYLTSFPGDGIALLITPRKRVIITDFLYAEAASKFFKNFEVDVVKEKGACERHLASALKKYKIKKLGFESRVMDFSRYGKLKQAARGMRLIAAQDLVERLREVKEKGEILAIRRAARVTAKTFVNIKKSLRPGITELSLSRRIKKETIENGADGTAFEPIVATQPASSQPHYTPRPKALGRNKAVLIDMGARLNGYNSDLTRMCALGKISSKFKELYTVLYDAQRTAIELIRPGIKISDVDFAARRYITSKGLGRFFGHNLGHGIGLEIHERPVISANNAAALREDMVFTIEPGIYIPGYGGLRIEDMVRVTKTGCEVLTDDIDKSI